MNVATAIQAGNRSPSTPMSSITLSNGTTITLGGPYWVPNVDKG